MRSIPLILILYVTLLGQLQSQLLQTEAAVVNYNIDNGLPDNSVHDVYCDDRGYIWLATEFGVAKFNGHSFQYFNQSHGLNDNEILRLNPTKNNEIWLANANGIPSYIKNDQVFDPLDSISKNYLSSINEFTLSNLKDSKGNVWISNKWGIIKIDKEGKIQEKEYDAVPYLFEFEDNILGIISSVGLVKFNTMSLEYDIISSFIHLGYSKPTIEKNILYAISLTSETSKKRRLVTVDLNSHESKIIQVPKIINDELLSIHAIRFINNKIYLCSSSGLIVIKDGVIIDHLLKSEKVTSACLDQEGGIWVTTEYKGVFYWPHKSAELLHLLNQDQSSIDVLGSGENQLFIGNRKTILSKVKDEWEDLNIIPLNSRINHITKHKNYLLLHTDESLLVEDTSLDTTIKYRIGGSNWSLIDNDTLYLSMYNGHCMLPMNQIGIMERHFQTMDDKAMEYLQNLRAFKHKTRQVEQLTNDIKIILTKVGIFLYEKNEFIKWEMKYPKLNYKISNIVTDGDSLLWLSTKNNGIIKFNTQSLKFSVIANYNELLDNNVKSLHYIKSHEMLCIGSKNGVDIIYANNRIKLTSKDGLPSSNVNKVITFGDSLYALTSKGLYRIAIDELKKKNFKPHLYITSIKANDRLVTQNEVVTNYNQNNILIKTDAVAFKHDINFFFRLNNNEWERSSDGNISLRSLSKGKYALEIKAISDDFLESNIASLKIKVLPPLWESWWFLSLVALTILLLIYLFFRLKVLAYNRDVVKEILLLIATKLKSKKYIEIKNVLDGTKTAILLDHILRVEGAKDYVKIFLEDRTILTKKSMKKLIEELNQLEKQTAFLQTHKSHIVRIDKIEGYHYQFVLINSDQIPIGRSYKSSVKETLSFSTKKSSKLIKDSFNFKFRIPTSFFN